MPVQRASGCPRVLLAEDHPTIAAELSALLALEYDVVDVVHDGQAVISASRTLRPDVIVSDIAMPGISGLDAAETLLADEPGWRFVVVTVLSERDVILRARGSGVLGYVLKCDCGEQLLSAVGAALRGEHFLSSAAQAALDDPRGPSGSDAGRR